MAISSGVTRAARGEWKSAGFGTTAEPGLGIVAVREVGGKALLISRSAIRHPLSFLHGAHSPRRAFRGGIVNHARIALALSLAGFLVMPQPSSAEDSPRQLPVLVHMQAALDVDRDGNVTAVTFVDDDDRQVPDAIRQRGEQVAKSWKFVPPTKAGKTVGGRTYAGMNACIVPAEGGLEFTVAYTGNGPGTFYRPSRKPRSHGMPIGRLANQGINRLGGTIVYVVSVDGKARLETATLDDPELQRQYGERWQRDQREDQKNFRYRPELIDGVPIATRVETTVEQVWFATGDRKAAARMAADNQESAERSDACQALRGQEDRQIASDSPFKRIGG